MDGAGGGAWAEFRRPAAPASGRARLTQEELAEAAGLSPRSVSDLERGINRTARKDSALLLADALSLTGQVRVLFVAAARGRAPEAAGYLRDALAIFRRIGSPAAQRVEHTLNEHDLGPDNEHGLGPDNERTLT